MKEEINKQLTIANIRLSILTLWQYVSSRKVMLPGDRKVEDTVSKDKPPSLDEQLASVQAHIEDLHVSCFNLSILKLNSMNTFSQFFELGCHWSGFWSCGHGCIQWTFMLRIFRIKTWLLSGTDLIKACADHNFWCLIIDDLRITPSLYHLSWLYRF